MCSAYLAACQYTLAFLRVWFVGFNVNYVVETVYAACSKGERKECKKRIGSIMFLWWSYIKA